MLYLLDANVLIDANRDYYPIAVVPEFWAWLEFVCGNGDVKMPVETFEEVTVSNDALSQWAKSEAVKSALLLEEAVEVGLVSHATSVGYAADLSDIEIKKVGRDPFLVAYGLVAEDRCIVSTEVSKPKAQRANRRLPDVCDTLGVNFCHTFRLIRDLKFSTGWQHP